MASGSGFDAVDVVRKKRDGGALSNEEIAWLIDAYVEGSVPDEQVSALLMAIFFRGMTTDELSSLTRAMVASGERLDLSRLGRPTVDKHSTGGVGDKVSLVLAPLVAACGAAVPQLSGRGLGHTGGTLDKLETIPGLRTELSSDEIHRQLEDVGCVICAAGAELCPADRKLYALRDVTATVESVPLISASILSKKIAEGTASLVLDVKVGSGAFFSERERATVLAETMVALGRQLGLRVRALLSAMDVPLGRAVGNALEVAEALEVLSGHGPDDLVELTLALAREMLDLSGLAADPARALADGSAASCFRAMVSAQGGDPDAALARAPHTAVVEAARSGYVVHLDARRVGVAAWRLGAGRARKEDAVSAGAGVVCLAKPGELVEEGDPLLELYADEPRRLERGRQALKGAVEIADAPPPLVPLLIDRVV